MRIATILAATSILGLAACQSGVETAMNNPKIEDEELSPVTDFARRSADTPGTFWVDSATDADLITYPTQRNVELCLDKPADPLGDEQVDLRVTWDGGETAVLAPGTCLNVVARQIAVRPAEKIPPGAVLRGRVEPAPAAG
jgi:hypothetical protein